MEEGQGDAAKVSLIKRLMSRVVSTLLIHSVYRTKCILGYYKGYT